MARSSKVRKIGRLLDAVGQSYKTLAPIRESDMKFKRAYMGHHFAKGGEPMALNLINRSMVSLLANLASDTPTAEIDPEVDPDLNAVGDVMSRLLTKDFQSKRMNYRRKSQILLVNAVAGAGVAKIGRGPSSRNYETDDGRYIDRGEIYVDVVPTAAWVIDTDAMEREERMFEGHWYRPKLRDLRDSRMIDKATAEQFSTGGKDSDEQRGNVLGSRDSAKINDVIRRVDLVDLWVAPGVLGREAMYLTVPGRLSDGDLGEPITMREWSEEDGPAEGPYEVESFYPTPENAVDTPLGPFWLRMGAMVNAMVEKAIEDDMRLRTIGVIDDSMDDEKANAIINAKNGAIIKANAALVNSLTVGGAGPERQRAVAMWRQMFGEQAYSADQLAGLPIGGRADAPTATEVEDVSGRQDVLVGFVDEQHYSFGDAVVRQVFYHRRRDPMLNETVWMKIAGIPVPVPLTAKFFEDLGDVELKFQVQRGSMKRKTSAQKNREAIQSASVVIPLAQNLAAADPMFDARAFCTSLLKQTIEEDELRTWWRDMDAAGNRNVGTVPMVPGGAFAPVTGPGGVPAQGGMGAPGFGGPQQGAPQQQAQFAGA